MSAPYLPSKSLHNPPAPPKCPSNTILKNACAVSLVDLLTADTLLGVALAWGASESLSRFASVDSRTPLFIAVSAVVLCVWIYLHVAMGLPSNLAYYFGFGKPPHVFKTCACFPTPAESPPNGNVTISGEGFDDRNVDVNGRVTGCMSALQAYQEPRYPWTNGKKK